MPGSRVDKAPFGFTLTLMWISNWYRAAFICSCAASLLLAAQVPPRETNTTLRFPAQPPVAGYSTVDAFPGLTFNQPLLIASPPGETNRLFIGEKPGRIQVIPDRSAAIPTQLTFLDISARVNPSSEGGLLGLAFHPGYVTNGFFYVVYTLNTTTGRGTGFHVRLARFQVSDVDPNRALPESEVPLISQLHRYDNHNAGDLHFGPDGYLYVAVGDEGGGGDPFLNSRVIDRDFFAAILRIDVDERSGSLPPHDHPAVHGHYAIPPDNPFLGATRFDGREIDPGQVRTEFYAVGLRNPWRFTFDSATGRLFCADVGQGAREEVNLIEAGGHYGWNYREGTLPFRDTPPPDAQLIDPILDYPRAGDPLFSGTSITGGIVYRGQRMAELHGDYVFGDWGSGNIWALGYDGTNVTDWTHLTTGTGIVSFGHDPVNGDVLFTELTTGRVRRLIQAGDPVGDPLPPTLADTGAFSDLASLNPQAGVVPYEVNAPFWADHAVASRWFSVPDPATEIGFNATGHWELPAGTVWIQHFDLDQVRGDPSTRRRVETQFLVRNAEGIYGLSYRWDDTQTNAHLVPEEGLTELFEIIEDGEARTQSWRYPSRSECLSCHTPHGGFALGFNTFQLNREEDYGQTRTNQLLALSQMGYFSEPLETVNELEAMVNPRDENAPVEERVRSYLAVNCSSCHQPAAPALGFWDARFSTELGQSGILDGRLVNDQGNPAFRVIKPGSVEESMIWRRIRELGPGHMPPVARSELDRESIALLEFWIQHLHPGLEIRAALTPDGQIELVFPGSPGRTYRIEESTLLDGWSSLATVSPDAEGQVTFREPVRSENTTQFYRAVAE
jgi:uncharacterized repeat protein (TIGR03806 family)